MTALRVSNAARTPAYDADDRAGARTGTGAWVAEVTDVLDPYA
ncbi:hypothetical protein [Streptomyces sp. SID3343]|nr:hypothetical protein [Streptomyces sp. SID3343]